MAAITKGTAFTFGTDGAGTQAGFVVQSYNTSDEFALRVEAKDENGVVITRRYDDRTQKFGFTGLVSGALPAIGADVTVGAYTGTIIKVSEDGKNDGYLVVTIEAETSEGVTGV